MSIRRLFLLPSSKWINRCSACIEHRSKSWKAFRSVQSKNVLSGTNGQAKQKVIEAESIAMSVRNLNELDDDVNGEKEETWQIQRQHIICAEADGGARSMWIERRDRERERECVKCYKKYCVKVYYMVQTEWESFENVLFLPPNVDLIRFSAMGMRMHSHTHTHPTSISSKEIRIIKGLIIIFTWKIV